ncbi:hypothetical protein [Asticcacaulis sp. YBE204]|uniref:hypothetical protein n=1 Tax=Asticcacaulis sp. YBE204 TaxID=1282363 RepID=UPI0003C3C587|nr:hypothetical protein [Asticcacaulis sp. YBE204]ESQ79268.1 hypothetical protein AEYBE204_09675 [Asticcacaulis sp. YBE204]
MSDARKPLNFDDLSDFDAPASIPSTPKPSTVATRKAIDKVAAFPSREASTDSQMNVKGPEHVLERFRAMAKAERYRLGEFIEILMDEYEASKSKTR